MVSFVEFLWAASAVCVIVTLYSALRKRRATRSWGIAAAVGLAASTMLELYLRMDDGTRVAAGEVPELARPRAPLQLPEEMQ